MWCDCHWCYLSINAEIALFWVITQTLVVISYRHFETTYRSYIPDSRLHLNFGFIGCPETSVWNYSYYRGNWAFLGNYADISGNLLSTFRDNVSVLYSGFEITPEFWAYRLSRNVGMKLQLLSAHFLPSSWRKPEITRVSNCTVKPRFTNASYLEQFGLRTNFPDTKRIGWRTVSRVKNTQAVNIVER